MKKIQYDTNIYNFSESLVKYFFTEENKISLNAIHTVKDESGKILGENEHLEINIFTDAITNVPPGSVNQQDLSEDQIIQLAERTTQIDLRDIQVKLIGIGKTGVEVPQPPQDYILLLRSYAEAMCENTRAKCITLTAVIE